MYELTYIINPALSETNIAAQTDKVASFINELGGEIKKDSTPVLNTGQKRKLSYPIKKEKEGYFISLDFLLSSDKLEKLNHQLKLEKDILRYLIISKKIRKLRPMRVKKFKERIKMAERPKEKVKLEELDKKLEELLKE